MNFRHHVSAIRHFPYLKLISAYPLTASESFRGGGGFALWVECPRSRRTFDNNFAVRLAGSQLLHPHDQAAGGTHNAH